MFFFKVKYLFRDTLIFICFRYLFLGRKSVYVLYNRIRTFYHFVSVFIKGGL